MQFKTDASETKGQDIVSVINDQCDSDATSYPIASKTLNANIAYEELVGLILQADGTWQFDDDVNNSTLPRGTGNLVEGQESYTFASTYLEVDQIDILDTAGVYRKILPLDPADLGDMTPEEYFGSTTSLTKKGMPEYYDIQGTTIRLYPAPTSTSVTLTNGIRVLFRRTVDLFTVSDTTQTPVIPSVFHYLIGYMASLPFCAKYKKDRVAWLEKKIMEGKQAMVKFYSKRERDRRKIMTMAENNYL